MRFQASHFPLLFMSLIFAFASTDNASAATLDGARSPYGSAPVVSHVMPNGLTVLVAPSKSADLVTIDAWVGAGTRRETAEINGVAHFMEHLLFKGTPTRKPGEIDAAIEDLGGTLNASTSYDWAHFYVTVASADVEPTIGIISDALMNAELRQSDMDKERPVILSEMAREDTTPERRIAHTLGRMMYPEHPYGRPLLGTAESLAALKRQTVLDFYHAYYVPGNVTLVVAGNITPERAQALAEHAFGAWKPHPVPADKAAADDVPSGIRVRNQVASVKDGYCILGFKAPAVGDQPDTYVMDVLLTILGQGGNCRLEQELKNKRKLVTEIGANYLTQHDPGVLSISATFDPGNLEAVRDGILDQITNLRDTPVSNEELQAAKHSLLSSYLFDIQTTSGRANALGFYNTINSYQYDVDYIENFEGVTADEVKEMANKYLDPQAYTLVTLLPRNDPVTASSR